MSFLIYPTIDLFLYDLREGLGENSHQIKQNQTKFLQKLKFYEQHSTLPLNQTDTKTLTSLTEADGESEVEYLELLGKQIKTSIFQSEQSGSSPYPFKGCYYPVRINDTFGLLIDCSVEPESNSPNQIKIPYPIDSFNHLKNYIEEAGNHQSAELGETWMISGEIPPNCPEKPEQIAKKCYQALFNTQKDKQPDDKNLEEKWEEIWKKNLQGQGRLFGGFLFELWGTAINSSSNSQDHHVIIALFPDQKTAEEAGDFNIRSNWMRLFCYRHKILWAYRQSRELKAKLKADFSVIDQEIKDIQEASVKQGNQARLGQILDKAQKTLSRYSLNLSYFEDQIRTIEINLHNYKLRQTRLQNISDETSEKLRQELGGYLLRSSDLSFLEKFSDLVTDKHLLQVKKDLDFLSPGLKLIEGLMNSIASVRSIIEIKQADRDRAFQNNIAIVGIGAGAASVVSSASSSYIGAVQELPWVQQYLNIWQLSEQGSKLVITINFSIFTGVLVALLTATVIKIGEALRVGFRS
jgi:hypothetical protein